MQEQLTSSLQATYLTALVLQASTLFDVEQLHANILSALSSDPLASIYLSTSESSTSCWSVNSDGFLHLDNHIYVSDSNDLHLCVLHYKHNHPLFRHFRQNQTLELIHHEYTWLEVQTFIKEYISSCTTCVHTKVPRHKPYGLLKQLPISLKPWNSISIDFIEQLTASSRHTAILVVMDHLSKK